MKCRPKKDFQLEHMQIFKCPALPHRLVTVLLYQKHLLPSKNYSTTDAIVLITAKGAVLFYLTSEIQ